MATRGVVLLAMGSPLYGRMAFNCALTLKAQRPQTPVRLWWQGRALQELQQQHLDFFDELIELPQDYYIYDGKAQYFKVKTRLNELTPFDETLYLDADVAFFRNGLLRKWLDRRDLPIWTAQTFNLLSCDTGEKLVETPYGHQTWSDPVATKKHFEWPEGRTIAQINSSFLFWKKTRETEAFWQRVEELWDEPLPRFARFRNTIPDELLFNIAAAEQPAMRAPEVPFTPIYCNHEMPWPGPSAVRKRHFGITTYGEAALTHVANQYNYAVETAHEVYHRRFRGVAAFKHINKNDPRYKAAD